MSVPASSTEPELDSQLGNSGRGQLAAHTARHVCLCGSATEPGEEGVVVVCVSVEVGGGLRQRHNRTSPTTAQSLCCSVRRKDSKM